MGSIGLYIALLCCPGLCFSHAFTRGAITIYSDEPIPPGPAGQIIAEVEERLAHSPLATPARLKNLRVYICNSRWRFVLFANTRYKVGGLVYTPISDNVFLRKVRFDRNCLVGHSGKDTAPPRTISYYIAHEIMHVLVGRELGIVRHWRLPAWKNEGYADLIAKGVNFDYGQARKQLRNGDPDLDPNRSGLYLRYHLLVAYLLIHRGISVHELLNGEFDPRELEAEILARDDHSAFSPNLRTGYNSLL